MDHSKKKVAVIGLGNIGKVVASNLVKGNRDVIVADKTFAKAQELATGLGNLATPLEVAEAIKQADIVVLAVWFSAIQELFGKFAKELEGKIIIDPSNPIAPDEKGGFKKIIGEKESSGEILAGLLPKDAKFAKALGSLGAASLASAAHNEPKSVLFYATNNADITADVETLIRDNGFDAARLGGLDKSIRMEVFGDLHEFGAIAKPVTLAEAQEKI
jgi:predicted dinucleotide-binding enzyme